MKVFAVLSKVLLTQRPAWLDAFFTKYGTSFGHHVTLKQACFLEEDKIQDVKDRLASFFRSFLISEHEIVLTFDDLVVDTDANGRKTIMINAKEYHGIDELQRGIVSALKPYSRFVYEEAKEWERNFKPHITIAADLSPSQYESVRKELGPEYLCKGVIREVVLIVADKATPEEADKPKNQTVYHL